MSKEQRFAKEAIRKLHAALDLNTSVYIYGATGFGKTNTVESVLNRENSTWISAADTEEQVLQSLLQCDPSRYVVLDNLLCVECTELQQRIVRMISQEGFRMVLISRTALPGWLVSLLMRSMLLVITEDDLRVTEDELAEMCEAAGLQFPAERMRELLESTEGNTMALNFFIQQTKQGKTDEKALTESILKAFMDYLDEQVISSWSRDVQVFLMQVSLVDTFTPKLAEYITGDDDSAALLSHAEKVGNILTCTDGEWRIRPVLLETLRARAVKQFGRKRCNQLLYNAARYYEMNGRTMQALEIYRQCGEEDCILSLLMREARKHPGCGDYWALRRYYQAVPEEDITREPVLMTAMSMLYSMLMNSEKSEYWYNRLRQYEENSRGEDRNTARAEIAYLDIALPHRGARNLIEILKATPTLVRSSGRILRPVSLTNNQPSVMNGGKDFCEWTKTDVLLAGTLGPVVEHLLGSTGVGLVQAALGESAYEKGEDHFKVLSHLTKAQNQSENAGTIEMTWVVVGLQAKLALCTGDIEYAYRLVNGMQQRARQENLLRMTDSVNAFLCWLNLYTNETGKLMAWLSHAPDETVEFCTLNRYLYMVKIQVYMAMGKHTDAMTLLQRMLAYTDYSQRTYVRMECEILNAILQRRCGDEWKEEFLQVLCRIAGYHFVPVISEKGAAVLPLLTDVKAAFCQQNPQHTAWFEQVLKETAQMARRYPDYLKGNGIDVSSFSGTALQVLRMQAAGYTTKEIADQLHITQRTVKYHAVENYRKLDAKNLVDAVQIAQTLHLL